MRLSGCFLLLIIILTAVPCLGGEGPDTDGGTQQEKLELSPFPIIMYSPETRIGLGAGAAFVKRNGDHARPDNMTVLAYYTQNHQYVFQAQPDVYFGRGRWNAYLEALYEKYPDLFFGIGNDTDEDDEESYTGRTLDLELTLSRGVISHLRAGVVIARRETEITDVEDGGFLDRDMVDGSEGGVHAGAGWLVAWDSRDRLFWPFSGGQYEYRAVFYREAFGSDFHFDRHEAELRHFFRTVGKQVLALQAYGRFTQGEVPFYELSTLGGSYTRGIFRGRYRDRDMVSAQAEYRMPLSERWAAVGFASAGEVANQRDELALRGVKYSAGGGVRYALNSAERLNIRLDVGAGPWGTGVYFNLKEAF